MRPAVVVLLAAIVLAAGCVGDAGKPSSTKRLGGADPKLPGLAADQLPHGCGAERTAFLLGPDLPDADPSHVVGCLLRTPWVGYEPSIGLTSDGTLFLYPTWTSSNTGQGVADRLTGMGIARTKDHGATWTRHHSTIGPVNWHPFTADPFMFVDVGTNRVFMEDLVIPPFNCSNLSYSDDGGQAWTQTLGGCMVWDHVSFGAGKPVTSTTSGGYPNVLYRCGITYVATTLASFATGCQKSLDGGRIWQPPGQPAFLFGPDGPYAPSQCHGAAHHVFVDHRGWVWLPRGWCGIPHVAVSKDEGATWQRYRVHDKPMAGGTIAHDAGVGVDPNGTAYYFWIQPDLKPYLSISRDDGRTWGTPIAVAPEGLTRAGNPSLVAGGVGKIGLGYAANFEDRPGVHAVLAAGYGVDGPTPTFLTVLANAKDEPLAGGNCGGWTCAGQADFVTLTLGPDGAPWSSYMSQGRVAAATLVGAPSLWDPGDPNGRYKGP